MNARTQPPRAAERAGVSAFEARIAEAGEAAARLEHVHLRTMIAGGLVRPVARAVDGLTSYELTHLGRVLVGRAL